MHRYRITEEDLARVRKFGAMVTPRIPEFVDKFYEWLKTTDEFEEFFADQRTLERVTSKQHTYWAQLFDGNIDEGYLESRRRIGETHARIGLPLGVYFGAVNVYHQLLTEEMPDGSMTADELRLAIGSLTRVIHMDAAVVAETYSDMVAETIAAQGRALMEMSTPVTQLWRGILMLPVVGIIDSKRAQDIMNAMLAEISASQARNFILDISGVGIVDTAVANHLIKMTRATALMGCECIISGISPAIAQTIVELGIDVGSVRTTANMKDALATAFAERGVRLTEND
jgi:rsbT co-antagonist protein RsbR